MLWLAASSTSLPTFLFTQFGGLALVFIVLVLLILGTAGASWLNKRLKAEETEHDRRRYERRRTQLTTSVILLAYYLPALLETRLHSGGSWRDVVDFLRGHVFDGLG